MKRIILVVCISLPVAFVALIATPWIFGRPPLTLSTDAAGVITVDVQTLGEYQTTVARIRVVEEKTGAVVWEVRAKGIVQIHTFQLRPGANRADLAGAAARFEVVTPSAETFTLIPGQRYTIEVWGGDSWLSRNRETLEIPSA